MAIEFQLGKDAPPFQEAVDAFLAKKIMTRAEFDALLAAIKVKAFTAAYVHAADQLQTVYDATLKAIEKGTTLADFKKEAGEILTRPWHRETVFRTNVLSAYGKGHYDRAMELKDLRPYARYSAAMDGRTRPSHAALHGRIYPLDHPFWRTYWPPWGYNCRCGVTTVSQLEVAEQKLQVRQDMAGLPLPDKKFVSPAAGEWQPDLGKYPVGLRRSLENKLAGMSPNALQPDWKTFSGPQDIASWGDAAFAQWQKGLSKKQTEALRLYQSSAYREWNAALRADAVSKEMQPWIRAVDQAINKSVLPNDVITYRAFANDDWLANFDGLTGSIVTDKAYWSTTLDRGVADKFFNFLSDENRTGLLAEIRVTKGKSAAYLEGGKLLNPYEYELLMPRNNRYRVIDAHIDDDGRHRLLLEVV